LGQSKDKNWSIVKDQDGKEKLETQKDQKRYQAGGLESLKEASNWMSLKGEIMNTGSLQGNLRRRESRRKRPEKHIGIQYLGLRGRRTVLGVPKEKRKRAFHGAPD